jgi:hypothetical protein
MILYITILILALLVPVITKSVGIDQPTPSYKESSFDEVGATNYFSLPRGQPGLRASIIQNKSLPRNKGEPRNNTS